MVEDDADQLKLRGLLLERLGYAVDLAASPAEALPFAAQADLALMDLSLPTVEEGRALIRSLHEAKAALKIIVLTGALDGLLGHAERALTDAVLQKPCRFSELSNVIQRSLVTGEA